MTTAMLLLVSALAVAAPTFASDDETRQEDAQYDDSGGARETACEKGCIAPHDSSVIGCKMFKKPEESSRCVEKADSKKARCEQRCKEKAHERAQEKRVKEREKERKTSTTPSDE